MPVGQKEVQCWTIQQERIPPLPAKLSQALPLPYAGGPSQSAAVAPTLLRATSPEVFLHCRGRLALVGQYKLPDDPSAWLQCAWHEPQQLLWRAGQAKTGLLTRPRNGENQGCRKGRGCGQGHSGPVWQAAAAKGQTR